MTEQITRRLPVQLTAPERAVRASDLAQVLHEVQVDTLSEKARAKGAKEEIAKKSTRAVVLREVVRTNEEYRDVLCHEVPVPDRAMVDIVRTDTGQVVDTREMTETERQVVLFPPLKEAKAKATATIGEHLANKPKKKSGAQRRREQKAQSDQAAG